MSTLTDQKIKNAASAASAAKAKAAYDKKYAKDFAILNSKTADPFTKYEAAKRINPSGKVPEKPDGGSFTVAKWKASPNRAADKYLNKASSYMEDVNKQLVHLAKTQPDSPLIKAQVDAYNSGGNVHPAFGDLFAKVDKYHEQGQAQPGKLTPEMLTNTANQWAQDAAPSGFDSFMAKAIPVAAGFMGGAVLGPMAGQALGLGSTATNIAGSVGGGLTTDAAGYGGKVGMFAGYGGANFAQSNPGLFQGETAPTTPAGGMSIDPNAAPGSSDLFNKGVADTAGYSPVPGMETGFSGMGPGLQTLAGGGIGLGGGSPTSSPTSTPTSGSSLKDYMNLGGDIAGLVTGLDQAGGGDNIDPNAARNATDPFAPYRSKYASQLDSLMSNPSSVTSLPGYQFIQQQGEQGVMRQLAAQGRTVSGNEMLALREQDQGLANKMYNQEADRLATLSGAASNPANGGAAYNATNVGNTNLQQAGADTAATNWGNLANNPNVQKAAGSVWDWATSW